MSSQLNPFSTRFVRPGAIGYLFHDDQSAADLVQRLRASGWQGQIVGPHGSGKSTLLAALTELLEQAGRRAWRISLHDGQRALPADAMAEACRAGTNLLIVDGYEQLLATMAARLGGDRNRPLRRRLSHAAPHELQRRIGRAHRRAIGAAACFVDRPAHNRHQLFRRAWRRAGDAFHSLRPLRTLSLFGRHSARTLTPNCPGVAVCDDCAGCYGRGACAASWPCIHPRQHVDLPHPRPFLGLPFLRHFYGARARQPRRR